MIRSSFAQIAVFSVFLLGFTTTNTFGQLSPRGKVLDGPELSGPRTARRMDREFGNNRIPLTDPGQAVIESAPPYVVFQDDQPEVNPSPQSANDTDSMGPEMIARRDRIRRCLDYYYQRPEDVTQRSPWGVMHALIAYGVDTEVVSQGRRVNAIGWLAWNQPCRGMRMLTVENGQLSVKEGPGVQGHAGQFLAMLAQSRVSSDFGLKVDGRDFTIEDLIEYEKRTCRAKTELTFKLIGLSHYLDCDASWVNERGEPWDIPRLIKEELAQPVVGAACGGTHRMMGFSYAVKKRAQSGGEFDGQWLRAQKYVDAYHDYIFKLQNADGSFSTSWFQSRGNQNSAPRKLQTTGHMLEWLVWSLPDDQLADPRVVQAVDFLTNLLWNNRNYQWEIGPEGHALHALVIYDQRVFGARAGQRSVHVAGEKRNGASK